MKILVLSDSHSALSPMRQLLQRLQPDVAVHLGDYFDDGAAMAAEFPNVRFYQVPGNCDRYRAPVDAPEVLVEIIGGVKIMMTHGHRHMVKSTLQPLIADARRSGVQAVLFGHTHQALCRKDGALWVVNPGSCGYGASGAMLWIENGTICACRIIRQADL